LSLPNFLRDRGVHGGGGGDAAGGRCGIGGIREKVKKTERGI